MIFNTPLARVGLGLAAALVLATIAIVAVNRAERLTTDDLVGVYRLEPASPGNPTDRIIFQRFTADGQTWLETIVVIDGPGGLQPAMHSDSARRTRWSVDDGQLCLGDPPGPACEKVVRDPVTGDLTVGSQRLTRLRGGTLVE